MTEVEQVETEDRGPQMTTKTEVANGFAEAVASIIKDKGADMPEASKAVLSAGVDALRAIAAAPNVPDDEKALWLMQQIGMYISGASGLVHGLITASAPKSRLN